MSETDDPRRDRREHASSDTPDSGAAPGEAPSDPAYAAGAGFSGEASGATPTDADVRAEAGPDPLGSGQPDPTRPALGSGQPAADAADQARTHAETGSPGAAASSSTNNPLADTDAKTMAFVAHAANIATVVVPPIGTIVALVVSYLKKDTSPDWVRTHFILAIRTGFIAAIAAVALLVLSAVAVPLLFVGVGFVLFPLIGIGWLLLGAWIVVRSVVAMLKLNENKPYPDPETWLI